MSRYLLLPSLLLATIVPAAAQTTPFERIADTSTAIPGGSGNFVKFSNMVSVDATGNVAFSEDNFNSTTNDGIYISIADTIVKAAGTSTIVPGGGGNFESFSFFGNGMDGGVVAFRGSGTGGQVGIYAYNSMTMGLSVVANIGDPIPGGTGNFDSFTTGYVDDGNFAFIAGRSDNSQRGIYTSDGMTLTRIADLTTSVPDIGGTYGWSSQLGFDGGNLAFWANVTGGTTPGNIIGGFLAGNGLVTLATTATAVPGVGGSFTGFSSPADLSGTTVAFSGSYAGGSGIFTTDLSGGAITTVARTGMAAPGGGTFVNFDPPAIDGEDIAFYATTGSSPGIFVFHEGRLKKVITTADQLDGKAIQALGISENSLAGGYLAFRAYFTDTTRGIYRVSLSEIVEAPATPIRDLAKIAAVKKSITTVTKKLKKARKSKNRAQIKRFSTQLKKLRIQLRKL